MTILGRGPCSERNWLRPEHYAFPSKGGQAMTLTASHPLEGITGTKPCLLDLFCCAGGIAEGYRRAGFRVVGVDIDPQPNYPFEFHRADALTFPLEGYDAYHASPPCQRWAGGFVKDRDRHPDLVDAVRQRLEATGKPYAIENVRGAPLRNAVMICGGGLGCAAGELQLHRHRYFESNVVMMGVPCTTIARHTVSVVGNGTPTGNRITIGRNPSIAEKRAAMGIDWTTRAELSEAIPPVYGEHVGGYLMAAIQYSSPRPNDAPTPGASPPLEQEER